MVFKTIFLCAAAFLVQSTAAQTCNRPSSSSCGCQSITIPSSGGSLLISSIGPISPSGIAVATDLSLAGDLDISGELPYLSAVAFEGQYPTSGSTSVSYGCGDCVAITSEVRNPSVPSVNIGGCGCGY